MKRTSPEVKCLHPTSSKREMCTSSFSNMIYHKFSHSAAFYTLNGKNVNVMLEFFLFLVENICCDPTLESSRQVETVVMTGYKICFKGVIRKMNPKLSLLLFPIWSPVQTGKLS